jgi:FkbM family methyltransferase
MLSSLKSVRTRLKDLEKKRLANAIASRRSVRNVFRRYLAKHNCEILFTGPDHRLVLNPLDSLICDEVMVRGAWQRDSLEGVVRGLRERNALVPGGLFVDIGANIGTQTIYAQLTGAFSGGISIEAEAVNFGYLERNVALNGLAGKVTCVRAVVADGSKPLALRLDLRQAGRHRVDDGSGEAKPGDHTEVAVLNVEGRSLADILAEVSPTAPIGLVWMDVEGFEPNVMAGAWEVIRPGTPLCIEFTPEFYGPEKTRAFAEDLARRFERFSVLDDAGRLADRPIAELGGLTRQTDIVLHAWR